MLGPAGLICQALIFASCTGYLKFLNDPDKWPAREAHFWQDAKMGFAWVNAGNSY